MSTIWCIGRNYIDHAKELNNPVPKEPVVFLKAQSCLVRGNKISLPRFIDSVDYEAELYLKLDDKLNISAYGYALDLTARTLQKEAKSKGLPWAMAKSFKNACPISNEIPLSSLTDLDALEFSMTLNGDVKQEGRIKDMIFSPHYLVDFLLERFPLMPGDLILTGTPAGVGRLSVGDMAQITDKNSFTVDWSFV